jgi:predicted dehydrogenase
MVAPSDPARPSRRDFLKASGATVVGSALAPLAAAAPLPIRALHSQGSGAIRVGLLGCGGRGSGAAKNALMADPQAELVAVGDLFADMAENCVKSLAHDAECGARVKVTPETTFVGLGAYKDVVAASDVVLLCTTPSFRPLHFRACVEAGKHVFVEKPVAVDGPGLRSVLESCAAARQRRLNVVSGLCYRYERKKRETLQRIHDGAVGEITAMQCTYHANGLWHRGRQPAWTEMEHQLRNWLYFAWLSGDHIAEQHIHSLDKIAWAMKDEYPVKCTASGGRASRTDPKYGDVYDHFDTVFEWAGGVRLFSSCRQWDGAKTDVSDFVFGTRGRANLQAHAIWGEKPWRWRDESRGGDAAPDDMYQNEHDALFAAIRRGEAIDDGNFMCKSTLMAIMGRMSAYSGQEVTADAALNAAEAIGPDAATLAFDSTPPEPRVAVPGTIRHS